MYSLFFFILLHLDIITPTTHSVLTLFDLTPIKLSNTGLTHVDIYLFPRPTAGNPAAQIDALVNFLVGYSTVEFIILTFYHLMKYPFRISRVSNLADRSPVSICSLELLNYILGEGDGVIFFLFQLDIIIWNLTWNHWPKESYGMLWLDIEGPQYWTSSQVSCFHLVSIYLMNV